MTIMFIGESRSKKAREMGVHWKDGRLGAKQLFDALKACGVDPTQCLYVNIWEKLRANIRQIVAHSGPRVGMGQKVCSFLSAAKVAHYPLIHPAARGAIRKKAVYTQHVREVLSKASLLPILSREG